MNAAEIIKLKDEALQEGGSAETADALEAVRIKYLGRNGWLPRIMKELKDVDPAQRAEVGRQANEFKQAVGELLDRCKAGLSGGATGQQVGDVT